MTEQERMKQGYVWQDDDENMSLQAHTKALVREFNSMPPEDMEGREALLHDIFGKVGKNVWINSTAYSSCWKICIHRRRHLF